MKFNFPEPVRTLPAPERSGPAHLRHAAAPATQAPPRVTGETASSHASATWAGVTPCRVAVPARRLASILVPPPPSGKNGTYVMPSFSHIASTSRPVVD